MSTVIWSPTHLMPVRPLPVFVVTPPSAPVPISPVRRTFVHRGVQRLIRIMRLWTPTEMVSMTARIAAPSSPVSGTTTTGPTASIWPPYLASWIIMAVQTRTKTVFQMFLMPVPPGLAASVIRGALIRALMHLPTFPGTWTWTVFQIATTDALATTTLTGRTVAPMPITMARPITVITVS